MRGQVPWDQRERRDCSSAPSSILSIFFLYIIGRLGRVYCIGSIVGKKCWTRWITDNVPCRPAKPKSSDTDKYLPNVFTRARLPPIPVCWCLLYVWYLSPFRFFDFDCPLFYYLFFYFCLHALYTFLICCCTETFCSGTAPRRLPSAFVVRENFHNERNWQDLLEVNRTVIILFHRSVRNKINHVWRWGLSICSITSPQKLSSYSNLFFEFCQSRNHLFEFLLQRLRKPCGLWSHIIYYSS